MQQRIFLALAVCVVLCAAKGIDYSKRALEDEIHHLPGAPMHNFRMFSGYIPVGGDNTRQQFYWFVEAESEAHKAPLVAWWNGGPGCSALSGFMTEQGPFRPTDNGTALMMNEFAWNKIANMIFIEAPAGVGFSTIKGNMTYNDTIAASDNADFVLGFLERFSFFKHTDFYLSSESYGGHYLPTLAAELVRRQNVPTFKGFLVGNPLTYLQYRDFGQYGTFYGHQLLPLPLWKQYEKFECMTKEDSSDCQKVISEMNDITAGLDPYALDFPVCTTAAATGRRERFMLMSAIERSHSDPDSIRTYLNGEYQPCNDNWASDYLNRPDVQKAIHSERIEWEECSMAINTAWSVKDIAAPMMPIYQSLINGPDKLRILIYSGDDDSVCATMGSQQFLWDLGYNVSEPWAAWKLAGQTAGYKVVFEGGLHFMTVHGAGHMVPSTRPAEALALFKSFLNNFQQE